jgi:hypothetical protein
MLSVHSVNEVQKPTAYKVRNTEHIVRNSVADNCGRNDGQQYQEAPPLTLDFSRCRPAIVWTLLDRRQQPRREGRMQSRWGLDKRPRAWSRSERATEALHLSSRVCYTVVSRKPPQIGAAFPITALSSTEKSYCVRVRRSWLGMTLDPCLSRATLRTRLGLSPNGRRATGVCVARLGNAGYTIHPVVACNAAAGKNGGENGRNGEQQHCTPAHEPRPRIWPSGRHCLCSAEARRSAHAPVLHSSTYMLDIM